MQLALRKDTRSYTLRILLLDVQNTCGKIGLGVEPKTLMVTYIRDTQPAPHTIPLIPWDGRGHLPGGFREIDPTAMPGVYEIGFPDEVFAEGAQRATVMVQSPATQPLVIYIDLIAYDPYDSYRLGLECLTRESRHEVIARAFREVVPEIVKEFRAKLSV